MTKTKKTLSINLLQFIILLIALSGISYILIFGDFQKRISTFGILYPKPKSLAQDNLVPSVDLKATYKDKAYDGAVNVLSSDTPLTLSWETQGNPVSCIGRTWGVSDEDLSWKGAKDPKGGQSKTATLTKNNPYVYTIDCKNEKGDAFGDSVTINVEAANVNLIPYISGLTVSSQDQKYDLQSPIVLPKGSLVQISWDSLNTKTPYSICVSTGSWPKGYKNFAHTKVFEQFTPDQSKTYSYTIYCSNESSYTQNSLSIIAQ